MQIAEQIKSFFHDMGIHSTTIQPEFVDILEEVSFLKCCFLKIKFNCIFFLRTFFKSKNLLIPNSF